ncbi:MAG TPA: hypothetical protein VFW45_15640 [Candidatus Polarisedimenticolia bacterium]|nr:hypothetical protein [Candidatus Polarisedimenticolia bacterium]
MRQARKTLVACLTAALGSWGLASSLQAATVFVNADITVSETWTADNEYILQLPVYVKSGATLTIEPGTVVRGEGESAPGANDPGTLIITRGSKLQAIGTSQHPIVFTNEDDDNVGGNPGTPPYDTRSGAAGVTGTWGGVILLGRGYVSNNTVAGPNPAREIQIEGLTAAGNLGFYGNCAAAVPAIPLASCDDDDSGNLSYLNIRYGGFNLAANNEINGLTLGGVGRSTNIDHIEVFQNKDDGIELFGGAVNLKYVIMANGGDDGLDYDEGWRGKAQFVFVMQGSPGSDRSDKGGEHDGGNAGDASLPRSIPTIYNATYIGLGGAKNFTNHFVNTALHFRDNGGGRYYNSFFGDFGGATMLIEGGNFPTIGTPANTSAGRTVAAYSAPSGNCSVTTATTCVNNAGCPAGEACVLHYLPPASSFELELEDNSFWCFGNGSTVPDVGTCSVTLATTCTQDSNCPAGETCVNPPTTYGAASTDAGKSHYAYPAFTNAALDNNYNSCAAVLPIKTLTRTSEPPTEPDRVDVIDPRPATGSVLATTNRAAPNDGFFTAAPYRGAFSGTANWADGWTTMSRLGFFPPRPVVTISSNITTSQLWTADNDYLVTQPVYVTSGATLTIEAGTVVRGEGESAPGANDPGTVIITRGSKIQAVGTVDAPIVFTNEDDNNVRGSGGTTPYDSLTNASGITGTWGGLILLGRGYVSNNTAAGPNPAREIQIEGLTAAGSLGFYGNCAAAVPAIPLASCDDDDSGNLSYLSIRYGGFNLAANNEINGLTLGGVGRGTDIDHIEVFQNKDDGIELFGGAVNLKNVAMINGGDDGLDYDEGWRGKAQFVFVMQGSPGTDRSDKGGEHDGGNAGDASLPRSIPTIYNATYIGLGGAKNFTNHFMNTALHFRDNGGGRYYNSFFGDFGGATMLIEGGNFPTVGTPANTSAGRTVAAYSISGNCSVTTATTCVNNAGCPAGESCVPHYQGPASSFELELEDNDFWCFGNGSTIPDVGTCSVTVATTCTQDSNCPAGETCVNPPTTYGAASTDAGKSHYAYPAFTNAALENLYSACATPLPVRTLNRGSAAGIDPDPIVQIDPRPAPGGVLVQPAGEPNRTAPNDGFFANAPYNGAFEAGSGWLDGWSTLERTGVIAKCSASSPLSVPDQVNQDANFGTGSRLDWSGPGSVPPFTYDLLKKVGSTTTPGAANVDFSTGSCLVTNQFGKKSGDDVSVPAIGQIFFYAVRAGNSCGEGTLGFYRNPGQANDGTDRPAVSCP